MFQIFQQDTGSLVTANLVPSADQSYVTVREEVLKEVLYGDCSEEDVALAKALIVPQATAPLATPVNTSDANFGRVPRVYIECLRDRALTPSFQKRLYAVLPCQKVISMDTGHCPFFSAPRELAAHLAAL